MAPLLSASLLLLLACSYASAAEGNGTRHCTEECLKADELAKMPFVMKLKEEDHKTCVEAHLCPTVVPRLGKTKCTDGKAGDYECSNIDLLAFIPLKDLGSNGDANDIWGWTDPDTNHEYAIVGCEDGTSFVDVTEPTSPQVLGFLPTHTFSSLWRDVKVIKNHAYIVSEARNHGMQVYNLENLRDLKPSTGTVTQLEATKHYNEFGSAHNIVANEESEFLYSVGSTTCTSGLHIVNARDPMNPQFAGCYGDDGYVHDAQCLNYNGPDRDYSGKEICFCYNEDTLTIVDVTDKNNIKMVSRVPYKDSYYTHQGWLIEDESFLILNDELDELYGPTPHTRSLIWDVNKLEDPQLKGSFYSKKSSTDHNLYVKGNLVYESNYCAGLRILDISNVKDANVVEVGYFDVDPNCDSPGFHGAWSSYPYFESGTIIVNSIERGLFVLKYTG